MNDGYQYPKRLPNQQFRMKNYMNNKARPRKSVDTRKQGLSVQIDATKKNKINKNPQGIIKNNNSIKSLKAMQRSRSNHWKNTPKNQSIEVSCQTQTIDNQDKSRSLSRNIVVSLQDPSKPNLQDYEQEFLLKWKAKQFVTKLKKERQEAHQKIQILRLQAEQKRQAKLREIQQKIKIQKELQLIKRREQAKHKLEQVKFKQQRRREDLLLRELHQKKNSSFAQYRPRSNNSVDENINQLHIILDRRAKSRSDFQNIGKKQETKDFYTRKSQIMSGEKQNKPIRTEASNYKSKLLITPKRPNKLQQHLYLSIDDEKMLQDIKTKLDKLQTLRSQKIKQTKLSQHKY